MDTTSGDEEILSYGFQKSGPGISILPFFQCKSLPKVNQTYCFMGIPF